MNLSEQKAYQWLCSQGYKGIVFRARLTPDFISESGRGFEVKKTRNNAIWFSDKQFKILKETKNVDILVFNEGNTPIAIIPFNEISEGQKYWNNIRIAKGTTKQFYLDEQTGQRLDNYLETYWGGGRATSAILHRAINEFLDRELANKGGDA